MRIKPAKAKKLAIKYLQEQADIMAKYGDRPKLSGKVYQDALRGTIRTIQILSTPIPGNESSRISSKSRSRSSIKITKRRKPGLDDAKSSAAVRQMAEA